MSHAVAKPCILNAGVLTGILAICRINLKHATAPQKRPALALGRRHRRLCHSYQSLPDLSGDVCIFNGRSGDKPNVLGHNHSIAVQHRHHRGKRPPCWLKDRTAREVRTRKSSDKTVCAGPSRYRPKPTVVKDGQGHWGVQDERSQSSR